MTQKGRLCRSGPPQYFEVWEKADKNLGIVVMNRADYVKMVMLHLDDVSTYQKVHDFKALSEGYYEELQTILSEAGHIDDALSKALLQIPVEELHAAVFYCLPKIHKWKDRNLTCPGRPIASTMATRLTIHMRPAPGHTHHYFLQTFLQWPGTSRFLETFYSGFAERNNSTVI